MIKKATFPILLREQRAFAHLSHAGHYRPGVPLRVAGCSLERVLIGFAFSQ
jgi:hypothetical protein